MFGVLVHLSSYRINLAPAAPDACRLPLDDSIFIFCSSEFLGNKKARIERASVTSGRGANHAGNKKPRHCRGQLNTV
jgi:hypothetical protein